MLKRAFLTFAESDSKRVQRLGLLSDSPGYGVEFYEEGLRVDLRDRYAEHIKKVVQRKLEATSATVCLIGEDTHASAWVRWDLDSSARQNNKLIAMYLKGTTEAPLPELLKQANTYCWQWDPRQLEILISSA